MNETDWTAFSKTWTSSPGSVDAGALQNVVRSHRRVLLRTAGGEIALAIGLGWFTLVLLRDGMKAWELVWATTLWAFMAAAFAFVWWNRRGTWNALGESVAEYVRVTRLRAERQRRSIRFGIVLFVAEIVAIVAQLQWYGRLTEKAVVLLGASALIVAAWAIDARRKIARDLAIVEEYQASVD